MSRISEVIQNKNKVEKLRRTRRKDDMDTLRQESAFKAKLYEDMKRVAYLLEQDEVESVTIEIPSIYQIQFSNAIYSADLAEYNIEQAEGKANVFYIRRKFIAF